MGKVSDFKFKMSKLSYMPEFIELLENKLGDIQQQLNALKSQPKFEIGMRMIWKGAKSNIPNGWVLVQNITSDMTMALATKDSEIDQLKGRSLDANGRLVGSIEETTLTIDQIPSHSHTMESAGGHNHTDHKNTYSVSQLVWTDYTWGAGKMQKASREVALNKGTETTATSTNGEHSHAINEIGGGQGHTHSLSVSPQKYMIVGYLIEYVG